MLPPNSENTKEASLVELIFFSCTVDRVHISLLYIRVLQTQVDFVKLGLFQTLSDMPESFSVSVDAFDAILEP